MTHSESAREEAETWVDQPELRHKYRCWLRPSHVDAYLAGRAAGVAEERERCAKVADIYGDPWDCGDEIAAAIRAGRAE